MCEECRAPMRNAVYGGLGAAELYDDGLLLSGRSP